MLRLNNNIQATDLTKTNLEESKHHSHQFSNEESFINLLKDDKKISLPNVRNNVSVVNPAGAPLIKHIRNTAIIKQQMRKNSFGNINKLKKQNSLMDLPREKKKNSSNSIHITKIPSTKDEYRSLKHIEKICDSSSEEESDLDEVFKINNVLHYNNFIKQCWDNLIILFVIVLTIAIPFIVAFTSNKSYIIAVEASNCVLLLINIIITFMTSYIDNEDNVVANHKQIIINYLRSWFIIDVLSWFPYSLCVVEFSPKKIKDHYDGFHTDSDLLSKILLIFPLIQMIKILIKGQLHSLLKIFLDFCKINTQIERLFYFLVSFLLMNHVVACYWFFTAILQQYNPTCWVVRLGYIDASIWRLYIASFSWSLATVTTIGYGNISAGTTIERIYSLIVMFFGVVMFSFAIGSLSSIVNISDSKTEEMNQKLQILSMIKKEYSIDKETYERIRGSIKYDHHHNDKGNHNSFLQDLPSKLQIELSQCMHDSKIKQMNFFKCYPIKDLFAFVAPLLKPIQFVQRDILYKSNDKLEEMYFISKGTVSFCFGQEYNEKEIKMLKRYNNFGEIEMCVGELLGYNIKIKSRTCDLFVLKKADFLKLSIRFQEIIETFMQKSLMVFLRFKDKMMGMIQKSQLNDSKSESDMSRQEELSELNEDDEYVEQLECIDENIEEESVSNSDDNNSSFNKEKESLSLTHYSINDSVNLITEEKTEDKDIECRTVAFNEPNENNNTPSTYKINNSKKKNDLKQFQEEVKRLHNKFNSKLSQLIDFITTNNIDLGKDYNRSPLEILKEIQQQDKRLKYRNELLIQVETILSGTLP